MNNVTRTLALFTTFLASLANAQPLTQAFVNPPWNTYVFVSLSIPRSILSDLARQAAHANATLVLNGFEPRTPTLEATKDFIVRLNAECCSRKQPAWIIHPKLYDAFKVQKTPAFVLTQGETAVKGTFVSVTGDMSLANAYKFFAQSAGNEKTRNKAAEIYTKTYKD